MFVHKFSGTQPCLLHFTCPRLLLQCGKAVLCQKPSGQQSLKYLLSCPSEKEFVDPCSGWCFLPDRIYFCSWQAARVLEVSNRVKTEMEWASVTTGAIFPILSYCYSVALRGTGPHMDVYQEGSPSLEGPGFWVLSFFFQEVFCF